ncbi:C40 family peptidase [Nesterenkonia muleiensis]|uniref:C40 family peptidase n=1 Tax=Nesterenkonia muleiensis TaxID=2282648 RepID=UPI000E73C5C3|nr:C40 family peptidase [Nesterenkonia muleiensis]
MINPETSIQTRRERRMAAEAHARHTAKNRAAKTGRKVGVVLGTSGLLLTTSVAAMADDAQSDGRAQATLAVGAAGGAELASSVQATTVSASADVELAFDRPAVTSDPAAEPEPVAATDTEVQAATSTDAASAATGDATATGVTEAASSAEAPAPVASGSVINAAYSAIGTPYQWAGATRAGMDCSGFINWAYSQAGRPLPGGARSTHGMLATLPRVSTPQPGDIVISTGIRSQYHAGIYVGNGQMVGSLAASGVTTHGYHEGWHNVVAILRPS